MVEGLAAEEGGEAGEAKTVIMAAEGDVTGEGRTTVAATLAISVGSRGTLPITVQMGNNTMAHFTIGRSTVWSITVCSYDNDNIR